MKKEGEQYRLTELAKRLQSRFDEIMVDEYQDVNAVQDMIVTALSNGKNLFMVGDVKQSIYRFRQARPEIFNELLRKLSLLILLAHYLNHFFQ